MSIIEVNALIKEGKLLTLIEQEQEISTKIRRLRLRIKLQGSNPNPTWKRELKLTEQQLGDIQNKILKHVKTPSNK